MVDQLANNEVFVFGSNGTGFHGAGGAGLACRGESANTWRNDPWFQKAMKAPPGSSARVGKWAVYGVPRGFQQGREGKSYAVQTVTHPGRKRSISLDEIYAQLVELWGFAKAHDGLHFLMTPIGEGYAGYTHGDMQDLYRRLEKAHGTPSNIHFVRSVENLT